MIIVIYLTLPRLHHQPMGHRCFKVNQEVKLMTEFICNQEHTYTLHHLGLKHLCNEVIVLMAKSCLDLKQLRHKS